MKIELKIDQNTNHSIISIDEEMETSFYKRFEFDKPLNMVLPPYFVLKKKYYLIIYLEKPNNDQNPLSDDELAQYELEINFKHFHNLDESSTNNELNDILIDTMLDENDGNIDMDDSFVDVYDEARNNANKHEDITDTRKNYYNEILIIGFAMTLLIIIIVVLLYLYRRYQKKSKAKKETENIEKCDKHIEE
jgi:hypothetical protein